MSEVVYSPAPALRHPGRLFGEMARDLLRSRELAFRLALRDIRANYRQSLLGYLWAFVPPVLVAVPFILLNRTGALQASTASVPYAAYAVIGMVLWQTFVDSLNAPLRVLGASREMLVKVSFPREALVLGGIGFTLFNTMVRLLVLAAVAALTGLAPALSMLLFPAGLLALVALGTCIGLLLTPLGLLYRDVERGMSALTTGWLFLTPAVLPLETRGTLGTIMRYNPVSPLVVTSREWFMGLSTSQLGAFVAVCAAVLAALVVGWTFYRIALPHVIARLGM